MGHRFHSFAEVFLPSNFRLIFLLALLFPVSSLCAKTESSIRDRLTTQLTAQFEPLAQQLKKQPDWQTMQVSYDIWLPESAARLPDCQHALQIDVADHIRVLWGKHNVRITCSDSNGWLLRGRVTVSVRLPVWVASREIGRKQTITAADVHLQEVKLEALNHGFSVESEPLLGFRTQRTITAGQVLDKNNLSQPLLVRKGEQVMIRVEQDGLKASMAGIALQDGIAGQMIQVRNRSSQKEIQAEVSQRAEVTVHF